MKGKIFNAQEVQSILNGSNKFGAKKMKKIILIIALVLLPVNSFAKCVDAPKMGRNFTRCEDDTAICYGFYGEDAFASPQISCFAKSNPKQP